MAETSINELDDHCILEVFSYFSIEDIINAQKVCRRWNELCGESWKSVDSLKCADSNWYFYSKYSCEAYEVTCMNDLVAILKYCGPFVRSFDLLVCNSETATTLMTIVIEHCKYLRDVFIDISESSSTFRIRSLLNNCKNLERLSINNIDQDLGEDLLFFRNENRKLKFFSLQFTQKPNNLSGKFLEYLPEDLEELDFSQYYSIEHCFIASALRRFNRLRSFSYQTLNVCTCFEDSLVEIISNMKTLVALKLHSSFELSSSFNHLVNLVNLKKLDLINNERLEDENLINIMTSCIHLESLSIDVCTQLTNYGISAIAKLTKLKSLSMTNLDLVTDEPIGNFPDTLEFLSCENCPNFGDYGIELMKRASKFKKLYAAECPEIMCSLIDAAVEVTKTRRNNCTLEIHVDNRLMDYFELLHEIPPLLEIHSFER